jgi:16S rRNA (cytosine1402-N4)-methyltransferase
VSAIPQDGRRALKAGFTYTWMSSMRGRRNDHLETQWEDLAHRVLPAEPRHRPVMIEEVFNVLPLRPGAVAVDGTVGLGGHARRIAEAISPGGTLIGLDWDVQMLERAKSALQGIAGASLTFLHDDFGSIGRALDRAGLLADAILLDLGLNSAQVEDPARGFSFTTPGPLDMRMDRSRGEPASAVLNRMSLAQLEAMIRDLGDERFARAIARTIVERRKRLPLKSTLDLVECVFEAIPLKLREKRIHPATRTFQAVRIFVNGELDRLEPALRDAAAHLSSGGVLAVLSYHSGEDRIVKHTFRELARSGYEELNKKPMTPSATEIAENPRSRSAKLRALRRTSQPSQAESNSPWTDKVSSR